MSSRSPVEPLLVWCTQDANHPGCPGGVDQRGDYPSLGLGKLTSSGRSENTAAFITGAAQCHWVPKVSPFPAHQGPGAGTSFCNLDDCFRRTRLFCWDRCWHGKQKAINKIIWRWGFHNSGPTQCSAELACWLTSRKNQSSISTKTKFLSFTVNSSL